MARVADGEFVLIVEHTMTVGVFSVTVMPVGIVNSTTKDTEASQLNLASKLTYRHYPKWLQQFVYFLALDYFQLESQRTGQ